MSRRGRNSQGEGGTDAVGPQIEEFAVNTSGWAMKVPDGEWNDKSTILNAYEPSSTPWIKALETARAKGEPVFRSSLDFTSREASEEGEAGVQQFIVVGFTWPGITQNISTKHPNLKKQQPVGQKPLPDNGINKPDSCPTEVPVLVAAQIITADFMNEQDGQDEPLKLYALIRPFNGLCHPHIINSKFCFYLAKYRDNTTDLKSRGPSWNRKIAQECIRSSDVVQSVKQQKYKRARNTSKLVLEHKRSLENEIAMLSEGFATSDDIWYLEELGRVLRDADNDLEDSPPMEHGYLRKLLDPYEQEWNAEDSKSLLEELRDTWPDMFMDDYRGVTIDHLGTIKNYINKSDAYIEYHVLPYFLAGACFDLQAYNENRETQADTGTSSTVLNLIVAKSLERTIVMLGPRESAPPIPPHVSVDGNAAIHLLFNVRHALRRLQSTAGRFDKAVKDSAGDVPSHGTFQDIWEKYSNSLDTDSAKKSWMEAARLSSALQAHKGRQVTAHLGDVVRLLDKLKLDVFLGSEEDEATGL